MTCSPRSTQTLDLADANPRKIHITVPPGYRPRRAGGELYQIHHILVEAADRDKVRGVPVVSPALAIRQAIDWGVAGDMIEQAIRRAQAREHIGTQAAARLLVRLYDCALPGNNHASTAADRQSGNSPCSPGSLIGSPRLSLLQASCHRAGDGDAPLSAVDRFGGDSGRDIVGLVLCFRFEWQ